MHIYICAHRAEDKDVCTTMYEIIRWAHIMSAIKGHIHCLAVHLLVDHSELIGKGRPSEMEKRKRCAHKEEKLIKS